MFENVVEADKGCDGHCPYRENVRQPRQPLPSNQLYTLYGQLPPIPAARSTRLPAFPRRTGSRRSLAAARRHSPHRRRAPRPRTPSTAGRAHPLMRRPNARVEPRAQAQEQTLASAPASKMAAQRQRSSSSLSRRHLAGALAFLAATALALLLLLLPRSSPPSYGVVIDAGSTGSRVHVIAYHAGPLPRLDWARTASLKATPGLSSFAADPRSAGPSIAPLLEFARRRVPRDSWVSTEVRLMATAGLRLLDAATAEAVLESCRELLRGSGFQFQDEWATMISGAEEGIYAWVAANYALGTLGGATQDTTGIIELGGASIQVTFVTNKPMPPEFSHVLKLGGITYNLYSHSFLHLGQNVAYESLHQLLSRPGPKSMATHLTHQATYRDPCTPRGFSRMGGEVKLPASILESKAEYNPFAHAVGNFSECRSAVRTLLQKGQEECMYHDCRMGGAFVPDLEGKFLATENFFHTSKFFGLHSKSFLSDLMLAGEQFCHGDWSNIKKKYRSFNEGELLLFCFSSAYIVALLHDTLKFPMDHKSIDVTNQIRGVPVDWALGAFIVQKTPNRTDMLHPEVEKTSPQDNIRHGERPVHHNQGQPMSLVPRRWELMEFLRRGTSDCKCKYS